MPFGGVIHGSNPCAVAKQFLLGKRVCMFDTGLAMFLLAR
jgi:hypothetical protein